MANSKQGSAATPRKPVPFSQMSSGQKLIFLGKLVVSIVSFGFIFPNVMSD